MYLEDILHYLADLQQHNNRKWFYDNKPRYEKAKSEFINFLNALLIELKQFDSTIDITDAKSCIFRINRDIRFSKNKAPYKTNFGAFISKGGRKSPFAGYYIHLEPDHSFLGGGIYKPPPHILKAIRTTIYNDTLSYKKITQNPTFSKYYTEIHGERLKTAPKGFPRDFEDIALLQPKNYAYIHKMDYTFRTSPKLLLDTSRAFKALYPLNQYLNKIITTTLESSH